MYHTHTLRFKNETEFKAKWPFWTEDVATYPMPSAVRVIGITYRDDTPEGKPPVARNGYLVNLALPAGDELHENLKPFSINVLNPVEVFA